MENNNIITNEEVIEITEEVTKVGFGKGLKVGVGIGLVIFTSGIVYKYVAKPIVAKIKSKKEHKNNNDDIYESQNEDYE